MTLVKAWVAKHSGLPSFHLTGVGRLIAGDRQIAVCSTELLVSDAGAEAGTPTTYEFQGVSVTLTRASDDHGLLTDSVGRSVASIRRVGSDSRDHDPGVAFHETQSGFPIVRYGLHAPSPTGTLEVLTSGESTYRLRDLCRARQPLWVIHNARLCEVSGCDLGGARLVQPTSLREARTGRVDRAERAWTINYREVDAGRAGLAPVVTWGDWELWSASRPAVERGWRNWSEIQLAQKIAGMPS